MDEAFIDRATDEAVAQALAEFSEATLDGKQVPNPGGWIVQTAFWRAIDQLRREEREAPGAYTSEPPASTSSASEPTTPDVEDVALSNVAAEALHAAVSSLPKRHQQALRSYYLLELSTRDAARSLRMSEPTFRRRLKAAMKSLRQRFDIGDLDQGDSLAVEVGLAAATVLGGSGSGGATIADQLIAAMDSFRRGVRDAAAQIGWGTEAAATPLGSALGRTATQGCAAVVSACLAVGATKGAEQVADRVFGSRPQPTQQRIQKPPPERLVTPLPRVPSPTPQSSSSGSRKPASSSPRQRPSGGGRRGRALGDESGTPQERTRASTEALGVESGASPPPVEAEPEPAPETEAPASNPTQEANEALGLGGTP